MTLYIVATPIGNLGDMTHRAVETLKNVDLVAAEDTRTARKLFAKFEIKTPLTSFHAHSTERETGKIITQLKAGKNVALISEAGTPSISDPGYRLVSAAIQSNVEVVPVPGVSAVITALSASGLPTDKFIYLGFLPLKKGRQTLINSLKDEKHSVVFYESVHRIAKTLDQLRELLGEERRIVVARELTKLHEEFFRGTLAQACEWVHSKPAKGEFTVVLGGANCK